MVVVRSRSSRVLLLTPIAPRPTGNGLAMRAWRHAKAFDADDLVVVVLPVADTTSELWLKPPGRPLAEASREPLEPALVDPRAAPILIQALPEGWHPDALVVFRSYLAPLGYALAEGLHPARTVLDLDEDDVPVLESLGSPDAPRIEVVVRRLAPRFSAVTVASDAEAQAVAARYGLSGVAVVPNGVDVPDQPLDYADRTRAVTMVGNFTYAPNVTGAEWLRDDVWPRLTALVGEPCALRLVGPGIDEVDDIEAVYRAASVMAVPLFEGGGTRLKVLEAWALGRPVVATAVGVAGLDVTPGREALVADDPESFARALAHVIDDEGKASALIAAGREAVQRFEAARVQTALRRVAVVE